MATQFASVVTDQVQSRAVTIGSAPWPPVAPNVDGALETFSWQRSALGAVSEVSVLAHAVKWTAPADIRTRTRRGSRQRTMFTGRHRRQVSRQRQRRKR
jgi:hypothetical protein